MTRVKKKDVYLIECVTKVYLTLFVKNICKFPRYQHKNIKHEPSMLFLRLWHFHLEATKSKIFRSKKFVRARRCISCQNNLIEGREIWENQIFERIQNHDMKKLSLSRFYLLKEIVPPASSVLNGLSKASVLFKLSAAFA